MEGIYQNDQPGINSHHIPVLKDEVCKYLNIAGGKRYIDCTLGGGGHTAEIISRGGTVLGIDEDYEAIERFERLTGNGIGKNRAGNNPILVRGNFRNLEEIAKVNGFNTVDGILYDLGVSTDQLKGEGRGFGFGSERDEKLDMRLNQKKGMSAYEVINTKTKEELYEIFTKYGEEKFAWEIADAVVRARLVKNIEYTRELTQIILQIRGRKGKHERTHPATRVFQALRIYVNDEIGSLKESLAQSIRLIKPGGRLVIISFHSLEDRIVKLFFQNAEAVKKISILTVKPIRPTDMETSENPSARSGKLRAAQIN